MKIQVTFKDKKAIEIFKKIPRGLKGLALERALLDAMKKPSYAKLFLGEKIEEAKEVKKNHKSNNTKQQPQPKKDISQDEFSDWG